MGLQTRSSQRPSRHSRVLTSFPYSASLKVFTACLWHIQKRGFPYSTRKTFYHLEPILFFNGLGRHAVLQYKKLQT